MPMRPPRICNCGCGRTIRSGESCPAVAARRASYQAEYDKRRPSARERGYDTKWERERKAFIADNPVCSREGCGAPATLVHHIVPHRGDRHLFWSRSNWTPRCRRCHDVADQAAEKRQ